MTNKLYAWLGVMVITLIWSILADKNMKEVEKRLTFVGILSYIIIDLLSL